MRDGAAARARGYYYGWAMLAAVALGQVSSYGVLFYGFTVFLGPMGADLGWSRSAMPGAFSLALLVSGVVAVPAGWWLDRHGPRALMTAGFILTALLLLALSRVSTLVAFYAIWIGLGALMANWFRRGRGRRWWPTSTARPTTAASTACSRSS